MFEYWQEFKTAADKLKSGIDFSILSPQRKANIVPYMLEKITPVLLVKIITNVKKYPIYTGDKGYIGNGYVIADNCAFFVNPLSRAEIQSAYERSNNSKVPKFNTVGIIAGNNPVLKNPQITDEKLTDEHTSLKFFNKLIEIAINQNASDIHIAPRNKTHIYFRFRVDGVLVENLVDDLDTESYKLLANQILSKSGQEAGNFIRIVDAKFVIDNKKADVSVRVSMMPTEYLFKNKMQVPRFVNRIHNNTSQEIKLLSGVGLSEQSYNKLVELAKLNQGLIVVTGPTGSGKTTLLYAFLKEIKNLQSGISIQTLEDPVEKTLPGVADQCSINNNAEVNYQKGLKAFLRQDIDTALIGEIRDEITANKVTEIAMTGHLALSTLHTNTSLGTINRLRRLGVDDRDTADTLIAVIATRLVRRVCKACSERIDASSNHHSWKGLPKTIREHNAAVRIAGDGCKQCQFKAYSGRMLVAEVFTLDFEAQKMIANQKSNIEVQQYLVAQGQKTIWDHAIQHLLEEKTTLSELQRVLPPYGDI